MNYENGPRLYLERHLSEMVVAIYAADGNKPVNIRAKVTDSELDAGQAPPRSGLLDDAHAQMFMDELWRIGFRPSRANEGDANSTIAAHKKHIELSEMIVTKLLDKIKGVK